MDEEQKSQEQQEQQEVTSEEQQEPTSEEQPEVPPAEPSKKKRSRKQRWSFPTVSRCPRCGGTQTQAYSTQGKVQYRKCLAPVCQKRYSAMGTKVKK